MKKVSKVLMVFDASLPVLVAKTAGYEKKSIKFGWRGETYVAQ